MSHALARALTIGGAWLVVAGLALVAACAPARAHDWYPPLCCSGRDCHPTGAHPGAREPAATLTPQGWRLHDGKVIPHARARTSPDGVLHVCRRGGDPHGEIIEVDGRPCVFAPGLGS